MKTKLFKIILSIFLGLSVFFYSIPSTKHIEDNYSKSTLYNAKLIVAKYKINPQEAVYISSTVESASKATSLQRSLILGVISTESSFRVNPSARHQLDAGAKGLMQIHKTSGLMPAEPLDIEQNIYTGTSILKSFVDKYGVARGVEAYNAGNRKRNPEYYQRVRLNSEGFI